MKRAAYFAFGLLSAALGIAVVVTQQASWWQLVALAIGPDLALVAGGGQGLARGQIHPRAVPIYNAVHRFWAPGVLAILSLALNAPAWLAGGMAWIAHIAFDRSLGFGLRTREGFQRS